MAESAKRKRIAFETGSRVPIFVLWSLVGCSSAGSSGAPTGDASMTHVQGGDAAAEPPVDGGAHDAAPAPLSDAAAPAEASATVDAHPTAGAGAEDAGGCKSDEDCNQGKTGSGVVCSTNAAPGGECIAGCHSDADCPTGDACDQLATPHWACVSTSSGVSGDAIAKLALANVGQGACSTNTLGGSTFEASCTGNGGEPEYWCADFAMWVWGSLGVDVSQLTAAAGSFYVYGQANGTLANMPEVGGAVVFDYAGGGVADHVAIVTKVNADGTIETASGDWNGESGTEAEFSSTSSVVLNVPAYAGTVGTTPDVMGMTISGFVAPVGLREP